ncbi:lipase member K-like isoform X2 [Rhynchophorus ferrugineus]|uniref:lipase member K-like isoform X2 n=1 Tax=Rhynchophorus ferrugineus TaxID=354439 RepID=UPI003FCC405F
MNIHIFFIPLLFKCIYNFEDDYIIQVIKKYNYPVEEHVIETADGYLLKAQRIPHGLRNSKPKEVALLAHGMGGSAENWILLGPPDSLAYLMADRGYDVWLFNSRGTLHSRKHKTLDPNRNRKQFWNFSWHEIAVYDLVDTVNYILNVTKKEALFYVGHSQGTTISFVMQSEIPEMNDKIKATALLAPSAFLQYTPSAIVTLGARLKGLGEAITNMLNWYELPTANNAVVNRFLKILCNRSSLKDVCMDIIYLIGGANTGLVNKTVLPFIIQYTPSSMSTKQVWHYGQVVETGEFKKYDYGKKTNLKRYNSTKPPFYDFSKVKAPMGIFYGDSDPFATPRMAEEFVKVVPNLVLNYQVPIRGFNHLDFLLAHNIKELVYDKICELFSNYTS